MASRPVFVPQRRGADGVRVRVVLPEFTWHGGFALVQAQKNVAGLHAAAKRYGVLRPLEISSKSPEEIGRRLSAFSLTIEHPEIYDTPEVPLESAYQSAKVFSRGGPYRDLARETPRDAKRSLELRNSGVLVAFQWGDQRYPTQPETAFYDWLYIQALGRLEPAVHEEMKRRDGFTDIAFNPDRSINCQARSAALFVSLAMDGYGSPWVLDFDDFVEVAY